LFTFARKNEQSMMQRTSFKRLDLIMATVAFGIAATVYVLTIEPTASLWDCPEFIACGYKLEIGHPPGAPVFMLLANLFSQLASEPSQVAMMVNLLSALLSAGCIFFLFLTITHLSLRLTGNGSNELTLSQAVAIETCGWVGALCYTFSDTFWYSAVEAEVYAFSSFLTAMMFWLILKWEEDNRNSNRWLILIAYITGLSIGVHLLCLLCLPAMSLVVYFHKVKHATWWGALTALSAGGLLVAVILYGIIPGVVKTGGWFELLFTNVLGCHYNTGLICYIALLAGGLITAYCKVRRHIVRLSLVCLMMILTGYSSYGVIFIRANAQIPMNENNPSNIFALGSYLNREQYGDTPLLYGPAYCSEVEREARGDYLIPKQQEGRAIYRPSADSAKQEYEVIRHDIKYVYKENMFFPRMHSARHAQAYEDWMGGVKKEGNLPTAAENLRFFLTYQVNFMYWRYFLWNFVGRQNNIQGHGEAEHGNWITGFRWIDNWLLGCDTSQLPSDLKQNKGRNVFYGLPLLLGLLGILYQWRKGREGRQQLLVVTLLFVMTGLAIVIYLNQTPLQPRERDYAYAGSFYAFAIWIGLGVASISTLLPHRKGLVSLLCLIIPLQMVSQTWDDHDRSERYTCRDFGANYLNSTSDEGHPIIFSNGDNDTFPLWYNHEVEGVRTDTRVCNLEYLNTDWYIDQMKRPAYDSPALPIGWQHAQYQEGQREYVPIRPELKPEVENFAEQHPAQAKELFEEAPFELKNIIRKWVLSEREEMQCVPTDSITITTPASNGTESQTMVISLKGKQALYKNELMVLEILSKADWSRPVYLSISLGSDLLSFLSNHLVLEGLAYRVSPTANGQEVDVERLYHNVMHRFRFGGLNTKGIYVDEDVKHLANTHQLVMGILIDSLLRQGDTHRALNVCHKWQQEMPEANVPYTEAALAMARCFYMTEQQEQGDAIVRSLLHRADEWLTWIGTLHPKRRSGSLYSQYTWLKTMHYALDVTATYERKELYHQYSQQYEQYLNQYQNP
jgi:hypothetical protein